MLAFFTDKGGGGETGAGASTIGAGGGAAISARLCVLPPHPANSAHPHNAVMSLVTGKILFKRPVLSVRTTANHAGADLPSVRRPSSRHRQRDLRR
ncbi:hypothetical protein GCM10009087_23540 [Sphingomonas oligophenolica]